MNFQTADFTRFNCFPFHLALALFLVGTGFTTLVSGRATARPTFSPNAHINVAVRLVSGAPAGVVSNEGTSIFSRPSVSADGRYTAFESLATNLVPGQIDTNNSPDVFVFDRIMGTTRLVSGAGGSATTAGNSFGSFSPVISTDGRFITFVSLSTNLIAGQNDANNLFDVFLFDQVNGTTRLVSGMNASATTTGNGSSDFPVITADGRFVAFQTTSTNLVSGQVEGNIGGDVFVFDRVAGTTRLVSGAGGSMTMTGDDRSERPSISADGRHVAFQSLAANLVPSAPEAGLQDSDVFVFDQTAGTTRLVSGVNGSNTFSDTGFSENPVITADGRFIVFQSFADNLVTGQTDLNFSRDVFVFDQVAGATRLVSGIDGSTTTTGNFGSDSASVNSDGRFIAFRSVSGNLVTGQTDANGFYDIFVFDRVAGTTRLVSGVNGSTTTTGNFFSDAPSISADGRFIAFQSFADNLVPGQIDANGTDVFLFDRGVGETTLLSRTSASALATGNGDSSSPAISADGRWTAFQSNATDLATGDTNGAQQDAYLAGTTAFSESSVLFAADTGNHRVQKFDGTAWTVLLGNGVPGIAPNQANLPEAVAADATGTRIYVADTGNSRILFSTNSGATWAVFASSGIGLNQVRFPQGLALDSIGNLYVADTANDRVLRFPGLPGPGVLVATGGIGDGQVRSPRGLAVDSLFNLYIADRDNSRVLRLANANIVAVPNMATTVASTGIGPNQVREPEGVAVDLTGDLYVADTGNGRVTKFTAGTPNTGTILASTGNLALGQTNRPEGVTVSVFAVGPNAGTPMLVVGDTGNHRIQGRPLAVAAWQLIGGPNTFGSFPGQFRNPSKLK